MAKTKRSLAGASTGVMPDEPKPRMYIDLDKADMDMLNDLSIGDKVTLEVRGTVVGMSARKSESGTRGDIQLESFSVDFASEPVKKDTAEKLYG